MNGLQVFTYADGTVLEGVLIDGEVWLDNNHVCGALGIKNSRHAVGKLDADEKRIVDTSVLAGQGISVVQNDGIPAGARGRGNPHRTFISEAGFYRLVMRSDKPEAKAFQRWVTHVVLPVIRKTGRYEVETAPGATVEVPVALLQNLSTQLTGLEGSLRRLEGRLTRIETLLNRNESRFVRVEHAVDGFDPRFSRLEATGDRYSHAWEALTKAFVHMARETNPQPEGCFLPRQRSETQLPADLVRECQRLYLSGFSIPRLAEKFGVTEESLRWSL